MIDFIYEVCFGYMDEIFKDIKLIGFRVYFDIWKGKFKFDGLKIVKKNVEGYLFVIDDVKYKLDFFFVGKFCIRIIREIIFLNFCGKFEI